jgi:hypothetical protein
MYLGLECWRDQVIFVIDPVLFERYLRIEK